MRAGPDGFYNMVGAQPTSRGEADQLWVGAGRLPEEWKGLASGGLHARLGAQGFHVLPCVRPSQQPLAWLPYFPEEETDAHTGGSGRTEARKPGSLVLNQIALFCL